eukprot:Pgem_evm1s18635
MIILLAHQVSGHGQMSWPPNRRDMLGQHVSDNQKQQVINQFGGRTTNFHGHHHSPSSFRCHDYGPTLGQPLFTMKAGETYPVNLDMLADHPGDCAFYMSDKNQDQDQPEKWYKIAHFPGCGYDKDPSKNTEEWPYRPTGIPEMIVVNVTIPKDIPKCEHCVFRWEWLAVHMSAGHPRGPGWEVETGTQYYTTCSDVRVENDADDGSFAPDYTVAINGVEHITDYPQYHPHRNPYNDNNWPASGYYNPPVAKFTSAKDKAPVKFHTTCANADNKSAVQGLKKGQYTSLELKRLVEDYDIVSMSENI